MSRLHLGLNPSFAYSSPLPLFANLVRRARRFEVFTSLGVPTGEESSLLGDGYPISDGRLHGVRLFSGEGQTPDAADIEASAGLVIKQSSGGLTVAYARDWTAGLRAWLEGAVGRWHRPSLEALVSLKPKALRTLDYSYQARKTKRPDWSERRILPTDPLQGDEMAVELQCELANALRCALWWNAPPRFELSVADYEARLADYLDAIRATAVKPPILEYGNELWNSGFPAHNWLQSVADAQRAWQEIAAEEVATLKRVADRVFGAPGPLGARPYHLFVGGHIGTPDTLDKILAALAALGLTPDLAGPALYARPRREDSDRWQQTGAIPTQVELRRSCFDSLLIPEPTRVSLRGLLTQHAAILTAHEVPHFALYEFGLSLIAHGRPWKQAANEFHASEAAGDLVREMLRVAKEAGVDIACAYSACTVQAPASPLVDTFGFLAGVGLPPPPKAQALAEWTG